MFSLLVPCAIIALASIPLMIGIVPPNRAYGLRTRQTLADPDVWYRGNRFAGFALFIGAGISAAAFWVRPEYASGRSLTGVAILIVPLVAALIASFAYVRLISDRQGDTQRAKDFE